MSLLYAIDPGLSGAIAKLSYTAGTLRSLAVHDLPTVETVLGKGKARKTRRELNLPTLADMLATDDATVHCILEDVGAMPTDGAVAAFKFGAVYGGLRGVLATLGVPVTLVRPAEWKRAMRVPADKTAARARASELLPSYAANWTRVKDDGRAEAALLGLWGIRMLTADTSGAVVPRGDPELEALLS